MSAFDVIFLSCDEANAEENWQRLLLFHPQAKRVSGAKGVYDGLMRCIAIAKHEHFYLVDADNWILDGFRFLRPHPDLPDRIFGWRARNAVNDVLSRHGGVKLLSRTVARSITPDAVDHFLSINGRGNDLPVASELRFNSTPFSAWRGGFRECARRAAGIFAESRSRLLRDLLIWQTKGSDRPNGTWAILGARQGMRYGFENRDRPERLVKIDDIDWLHERFAAVQPEASRPARNTSIRSEGTTADSATAKDTEFRAPVTKHFPATLASPLAATLPPPEFLFVSINKRCNLRCQHCNYWTLDDNDRDLYLSGDRRREVISEFAEISPRGRVVTCGGESMLDLGDYFDISRQCRVLGLTNLSVINGTRIRTLAQAHRMIVEGPHEISVSLNSHREDLHDRTRGVKGSFRKAVNALRLLLEARTRHPGSNTRIYVMGLIFDENYRELDAFYDFVLNGVKADKLKLNFLQPSFGVHPEGDEFFASHHVIDPELMGKTIDACDEKYELAINPVWKSQVKMYVRSVQANKNAHLGWGGGGTAEHICNTYERNIMIDHYGVARLCFSTAFPGMKLRKLGDLKAFWESADPIRCAMTKCNAYCGISHSVRRENATLKPALSC
jgi:MoaA/NifB/PqqE/SkfB family radical SAM enzyme